MDCYLLYKGKRINEFNFIKELYSSLSVDGMIDISDDATTYGSLNLNQKKINEYGHTPIQITQPNAEIKENGQASQEGRSDATDQLTEVGEGNQESEQVTGETSSQEEVTDQDLSQMDSGLAALNQKYATTDNTLNTSINPISTKKDEINNVPTLKSAASNFEIVFVPIEVYELAYKNDLININRTGGSQTLDTIIKRGGYALEELDNLLPNWKEISQSKQIQNTNTPTNEEQKNSEPIASETSEQPDNSTNESGATSGQENINSQDSENEIDQVEKDDQEYEKEREQEKINFNKENFDRNKKSFELLENEGEYKPSTTTYKLRNPANFVNSFLDKKTEREYSKLRAENEKYFKTKNEAEVALSKLLEFEDRNKEAFEKAKSVIDSISEDVKPLLLKADTEKLENKKETTPTQTEGTVLTETQQKTNYLIGLKNDYNKLSAAKKAQVKGKGLFAKINQLSRELNLPTGNLGDGKISIKNPKTGKEMAKIKESISEKIPTKKEIETAKPYIEDLVLWNGDMASVRWESDLSRADVDKGAADIKNGKLNTVPARRLINEVNRQINDYGGFNFVEGSGNQTQKSFASLQEIADSKAEFPRVWNSLDSLTDQEINQLYNERFESEKEFYTNGPSQDENNSVYEERQGVQKESSGNDQGKAELSDDIPSSELDQYNYDQLEKIMLDLETSGRMDSYYDLIENELQKRERESIFNTSLNVAEENLKNLEIKNNTFKGGFEAFAENWDIDKSLDVIEKYKNPLSLTIEELKEDFNDSFEFVDNALFNYNVGLKLKLSLQELLNRGVTLKSLMDSEIERFTNDGYDYEQSYDVVASKLNKLFGDAFGEFKPNQNLLSDNSTNPNNSTTSPEYTQLIQDRAVAEKEVAAKKAKLDSVSKATNKNFATDQEDLFGERPAQQGMFDERADGNAGKEIIATAKSEYDSARKELSAINGRIKSFESGATQGTSAMDFEEESTKPIQEIPEPKTTAKPAEKIEDFGEKIGGAKKDFREKLEGITDVDIASQPLSKSFPRPDFKKLVESKTLTTEQAIFFNYLYDQIPAKPRKSYLLNAWTNKVKYVIDTFSSLMTDSDIDVVGRIRESSTLGTQFKLYEEIHNEFGFPANPATMGAFEIKKLTNAAGSYFAIVKGSRIVSKDLYSVKEAVDALKGIIEKNKETKGDVKLSLYQDRSSKKYFIGKKGVFSTIRLIEFDDVTEARTFLNENKEQLQEMWDSQKETQKERDGKLNDPRVGTDYRNGKDVNPEKFSSTFGFRGVEFGNYVNNQERQNALNEAYDAFMDLATVINVSPKALSLNGTLAMAFGARGSGNAMAHYEPTKVVINLTKTKGAGSLAHEWWHAFDNYLSGQRGKKSEFLTESPRYKGKDNTFVREEVSDAFVNLMKTIKDSPLNARSRAADAAKSKPYFSTNLEMSARAFENYVVLKMAEAGERNHYLANFNEHAVWVKNSRITQDTYPYPLEAEAPGINKAYQDLFGVLKEKKEGDNIALFQKSEGKYEPISQKTFDNLIERLKIPFSKAFGNLNVTTDFKAFQKKAKSLGVDINFDVNFQKVNEINAEEQGIIDAAKANGTYLKAPNGEKTNLSEKQWTQVRTENFKKFFGDWENDAENSSKVVDSNGEPMVVFHGTDKEFYSFKIGDVGFHFGDNIYQALDRGGLFNDLGFTENDSIDDILSEFKKSDWNILESIITIKNPIEIKENGNWNSDIIFKSLKESGFEFTDLETKQIRNKPYGSDSIKDILTKRGYDGIKYENRFEGIDGNIAYIAFKSNQIKSATENNGEFSVENNDIRYMHTAKGEIYGAKLPDGTIYINPDKLNANTPIHEFSHLWEQIMPNAWKKGLAIFKETTTGKKLFTQLQKEGNYSNLSEDQAWSEAMNTHIGNLGEAQYQRSPKGKMAEFIDWFKTTMSRFINTVTGRKDLNKELALSNFTDKVLGDLLGGKELKADKSSTELKDAQMNIAGITSNISEKDIANLITARRLQQDGKSVKEILAATNWFKGADGKWRLVMNFDMKLKSTDISKNDEKTLKLDEVLDYPQLFELYPKMRNMEVVFTSSNNVFPDSKTNAGYVDSQNKIYINTNKNIKNNELRLSIGHEVQHAVQSIEGFTGGTSYASELRNAINIINSLRNGTYNDGKLGKRARVLEAIRGKDWKERARRGDLEANDIAQLLYESNSGEVESQFIEQLINTPESERLSRLSDMLGIVRSKGVDYQIIGEQGAENLDRAEEATTRLDNLGIAREMETANKTPKEIRLATGWEKGVDGKWKYEIPDGDFTDETKNVINYEKSSQGVEIYNRLDTDLKDVFNIGDDLSKAHPYIENIKIDIDIQPNNTNKGSLAASRYGNDKNYYPSKFDIQANSMEQAKSILLHEIQHAIQNYEGFAKGGSIKNNLDAETTKQVYQVEKLIKDAVKLKSENEWLTEDKTISDLIQDEKWDYKNEVIEWAMRVANKGQAEINAFLKETPLAKYQRLAGETEARNVQTRANMSNEDRRALLLSETEDVAREDQIILMEYNGVQQSIAGENSITNSTNQKENLTNLAFAKKLDSEGKSREEISAASNGWYKGADGKWRVALDFNAKLKEINPKNKDSKTLGEILDYPQLFDSYPELKNVEVVFSDDKYYFPNKNYMALSFGKKIGININFYNDSNTTEREILGAILHEAQHHIQRLEGFTGGSNDGRVELTLNALDGTDKRGVISTEELRNANGTLERNLGKNWKSEYQAGRIPKNRILNILYNNAYGEFEARMVADLIGNKNINKEILKQLDVADDFEYFVAPKIAGLNYSKNTDDSFLNKSNPIPVKTINEVVAVAQSSDLETATEKLKESAWYGRLSDAKKQEVKPENLISILNENANILKEKAKEAKNKAVENAVDRTKTTYKNRIEEIKSKYKARIEAIKQSNQNDKDKVKERRNAIRESINDIKSFLASNKIDGKATPTEINRLIKAANGIAGRRDMGVAMNEFFQLYSITQQKAENRKIKAEDRVLTDVEFEDLSVIVKDQIDNGMDQEAIYDFVKKMDLPISKVGTLSDKIKSVIDKISAQYEMERLSPAQKLERLKESQKRSNETLKNKNENWLRDFKRKAINKFTDRQFVAKKLVSELGLINTYNRIIVAGGASSAANSQFDAAYKKIYKGLTIEERKNLDRLITLQRIISIEENRKDRGLESINHTEGFNLESAREAVAQIKLEIGADNFNNINGRAKDYFKEFKGILDAMLKNGIITQESYDAMVNIDYQPRLFVEHLLDADGKLMDDETDKFANESGGIKKEMLQGLTDGSTGDVIMNSEWILKLALASRNRQMAQNEVNRTFMTRDFPTAKMEYEKIKAGTSKLSAKEQKRFEKYFEELDSKIKDNPIELVSDTGTIKYEYDKTPDGFKKAYYFQDGIRHEFFMENELHTQWHDAGHGLFKNPETKGKVATYSGSKGLKFFATGNNPSFFIANAPRDFAQTLMFSKEYSDFMPLSTLQLLKDSAIGFRELVKDDLGKESLLSKYIQYGGGMDFLHTQGMVKRDNILIGATEKIIKPTMRDKGLFAFQTLTLQKLSRYSEVTFRLAIFNRSLQNQLKDFNKINKTNYKSVEEIPATEEQFKEDMYINAAASARSIMDFNQGGTVTKDLESLLPYINAATQGTRVAVDAFIQRPKQTSKRLAQAAAFMASTGIGLSYAMFAMFKGDDDDEESIGKKLLHAYEGLSKYQRVNSINIITPFKTEKGEYFVLKIAKQQFLSPFIYLMEETILNQVRRFEGVEQEDWGKITKNTMWAVNNNITPVNLQLGENPFKASIITDIAGDNAIKNPLLKASMTMTTGYDFFRDQPLDKSSFGKDLPKQLEGIKNDKVEDFYKAYGEALDQSPIRTKAAVESIVTSPDTNAWISLIYGGADMMASDKSTKEIWGEKGEKAYGSITRRLISETSDFNRMMKVKEKQKEKIDEIIIKGEKNKNEVDKMAKAIVAGTTTQKEVEAKFKALDIAPEEQVKLIKRLVDKVSKPETTSQILDIKYTSYDPKVKAFMINSYYPDLRDGSDKSAKVLNMLMENKILSKPVLTEYAKILKEE